MTDGTECRRILELLPSFGAVLAIKLYRLTLDHPPAVPLLPCLDHEAMLHGGIAPHMAVYLRETASDDLHELVIIPARRQLQIDTVSTWGEYSPASYARLQAMLGTTLPGYRVSIAGPSWFRGDRRVAEACTAQVSLSRVLASPDLAAVQTQVDRLQLVSSLMEKESRVASWAIRTLTGPLLAAAGVVTVYLMGGFTRLVVLGALGLLFVYYGLKAVQLTGMANRVWKRSAEYGLILRERRRLLSPAPPTDR